MQWVLLLLFLQHLMCSFAVWSFVAVVACRTLPFSDWALRHPTLWSCFLRFSQPFSTSLPHLICCRCTFRCIRAVVPRSAPRHIRSISRVKCATSLSEWIIIRVSLLVRAAIWDQLKLPVMSAFLSIMASLWCSCFRKLRLEFFGQLAWRHGWIADDQLRALAEPLKRVVMGII